MPTFAITDAHVHFYDPSRVSYPWLTTVPKIHRSYLPAHLMQEPGKTRIEKIVVVEADAADDQLLEEAQFMQGLVEVDDRIRGIVASARLERGRDAADEVERLAQLPALKGIRRLIQQHPEPDWCLSPAFIEGVSLLGDYDLTFDICIRNHQLASAVELVRRCPQVRFVLDHIAKPSIASGGWEPWATDLRSMAMLPNVACKMAGVATEADHADWRPEQLIPYVHHAIDCFGWSRLLFASDWPVMTLAIHYQQWIDLLDDVLVGTSEREQKMFYRDNANTTYRLT